VLKYNNIYNETVLSEPYNIAAIDSDAYNVAIYVNDRLQEIVSPNVGTGQTFSIFKQALSDTDILNLIYSGSKQKYSLSQEKLIFGAGNVVYVKNTNGEYLYTDGADNTSWSSTDKSRFFFNPYYFDSDYLWKKVFKKKPNNVSTSGLWNINSEVELFNKKTVVLNTTSLPSLVDPNVFSYFNNIGDTESISIDHFISINATYGDKVKLKTDKDEITFTYEPVTSTARMLVPDIDGTSIDRPLIHIPLRTINPNSEVLYSKILNKGLNSFTITRTIQGVTFNKSLHITRT